MSARSAFGLAILLAVAGAAGYWVGQHTARPRPELSQAIVTTGLALAAPAKIAVSRYQSEHARFPVSNEEAGLPPAAEIQDRYVAGLAVGPQGAITITYRGEAEVDGKTVVITPAAIDGGYAITWSCKGGSVAAALRPEACR